VVTVRVGLVSETIRWGLPAALLMSNVTGTDPPGASAEIDAAVRTSEHCPLGGLVVVSVQAVVPWTDPVMAVGDDVACCDRKATAATAAMPAATARTATVSSRRLVTKRFMRFLSLWFA
jgi:hypothetical protein